MNRAIDSAGSFSRDAGTVAGLVCVHVILEGYFLVS